MVNIIILNPNCESVRLTSYQKARLALTVNSVILFFLIILTPLLIKRGLSWVSEEAVEVFFLAIEMITLVFTFRQFDLAVKEKEKESELLDLELRDKEKELLKTFEYLGKMNVKVAMTRTLLDILSAPTYDKKETLQKFSSLLRIACNFSKKEFSVLKIVDLKEKRTVFELVEHSPLNRNKNKLKQQLLKEIWKKEARKKLKNKFWVFDSWGNNSPRPIKTFLIIPRSFEDDEISTEKENFLQIIACQCEIIYLLSQLNKAKK